MEQEERGGRDAAEAGLQAQFDDAQRRKDTDFIIIMIALIARMTEKEGQPPHDDVLQGYTRGQYKRAIKCLRVAQSWAARKQPDMVKDYDLTAQYIRERCLHKAPAGPSIRERERE